MWHKCGQMSYFLLFWSCHLKSWEQVFKINSLYAFCQSILVIDQILESILKVKSCKNKFFRTYSWNVPAGTKSTTFATGLLLCFIHLKGWRQEVRVRGGSLTSDGPIWPSPYPPPPSYPLAYTIALKEQQLVKQNCYQNGLSFMRYLIKVLSPLEQHIKLIHTVTRQ